MCRRIPTTAGRLLSPRYDCDRIASRYARRAGPAARSVPTQAAAPSTGRDAFICRGCYFVYDEAQGLPLAGIAPGTPFGALPRTWQCPDCGTDKTTFRSR